MNNLGRILENPYRRFKSEGEVKTKIRLEVQSNFQGMNDIKQHKVLEAKKNL